MKIIFPLLLITHSPKAGINLQRNQSDNARIVFTNINMIGECVMDVTGKVFANVKSSYAKLTTTDKRITAILTEDPEFIAFGTVAEVAARAQTSGPSVVRMAEKLGYKGFVGLQSAVRDDLSKYLPSSLLRLKRHSANNSIEHAKAVELHNVEATFNKLDESVLNKFIPLLADQSRTIFILASDQCSGPALTFSDLLSIVRPKVIVLTGSEYRITSQLIEAKTQDLLITIDFERHERWLVKIHQQCVKQFQMIQKGAAQYRHEF